MTTNQPLLPGWTVREVVAGGGSSFSFYYIRHMNPDDNSVIHNIFGRGPASSWKL